MSPHPSDGPTARISRSVALIRSAYTTSLPLSALAEEAGLSPFYFHRSFRSVTGVTPHDLIRALRLQHAKRLLAFTDESVPTIAGTVGYSSVPSFSSLFRRRVGCNPTQLRVLTRLARDLPPVGEARTLPVSPGGLLVRCVSDLPLAGHVAVAGLFTEAEPAGAPRSCTVLRATSVGSLPLPKGGLGAGLFVVAVPESTSLVHLVVGDVPGALYGRIRLEAHRGVGDAVVTALMAQANLLHPPVTFAGFATDLMVRLSGEVGRSPRPQLRTRYGQC